MQHSKTSSPADTRDSNMREYIDPVCEMTVSRGTSAGSYNHHGTRYEFCSKSCLEKFKAEPERYLQRQSRSKPVHRDPVCGMEVREQEAAGTVEHDGRMYYFCSRSCVDKFKADPKSYLQTANVGAQPAAAQEQVEHTCPMHPEVRQPGLGVCPKCGMGLEPTTLTAAARRTE